VERQCQDLAKGIVIRRHISLGENRFEHLEIHHAGNCLSPSLVHHWVPRGKTDQYLAETVG
jgi:hypothetical protein